MKKIFSLAVVCLLAFTAVSCDRNNDNVIQPVESEPIYSTAYDLNNVSFALDSFGEYSIVRDFNSPLIESDVVLIFRQFLDTDNQTRWQSIPRTLFLTQGELDYDFSYNRAGIRIRAGGTFDPSLAPTFINNQTFRVVVVPAKTGKNANVDLTNYDSVINFYKIKESSIKNL